MILRNTVTAVLILTVLSLVPARAQRTGTITQGSCYLTTEDKKTNLATMTKGLVVTVLGENAEGRVNVQVPAGDAKLQVTAGWTNQSTPINTGWVSKLFIKVDGTAAATPVVTPSPAEAAPEQPKKTGLLGLLGISSDSTAEETPVTPADTKGVTTAGADTVQPVAATATPPEKKKPAKVRSLLAESAKGKTIILVNIAAQKLWVYKGGQVVLTAGCRVGEKDHSDNKEGDNSKTRVGEHRLTSWHEKYSNSSYGAWTGSWFEATNKATGAFGAHTAKFNDRSAQYVHGTYGSGIVDWAVINLTWLIPGSHGCVRVRNNDVTSIRDIAPIGSQIVKVYSLKEGTQEAPPTADTYSNIYGYTDVASNGYVDPDKGELIDYKDPKDAIR